MSQCFVCGDTFNLQRSHDIPKYIGGTDKDGIRILCSKHHREYDLYLLKCFLENIGEEIVLDNFNQIIKYQIEIKKNKTLHQSFRDLTKNILDYYFTNIKLNHEKNIILRCIHCGSYLDIEDYLFNNFCFNCNRSQNNNERGLD